MAIGTVIIGLGNPLLRDDGVGIQTVRILKDRLHDRNGIEVVELYAGGLRLMEAMVGFERAVLVDAMQCGDVPPGTVRHFSGSDFVTTRNLGCAHDTSLAAALTLGQQLGLALPAQIDIWGVEADCLDTFGETLTPLVAGAVQQLAGTIDRSLTQKG